jgi:hypothetical protein
MHRRPGIWEVRGASGDVRALTVSAKLLRLICSGEVSERFKEHAWKACVGEILPWVRIPPSPPYLKNPIIPQFLTCVLRRAKIWRVFHLETRPCPF